MSLHGRVLLAALGAGSWGPFSLEWLVRGKARKRGGVCVLSSSPLVEWAVPSRSCVLLEPRGARLGLLIRGKILLEKRRRRCCFPGLATEGLLAAAATREEEEWSRVEWSLCSVRLGSAGLVLLARPGRRETHTQREEKRAVLATASKPETHTRREHWRGAASRQGKARQGKARLGLAWLGSLPRGLGDAQVGCKALARRRSPGCIPSPLTPVRSECGL